VRASVGDPRWEEDAKRSIELTLRTNSFRAGRAYINYGSHLMETAADLARGEAVTREGLAFSQRMGFPSTAIRWFLGNLVELTYQAGRWDEALELAEAEIAGEPHYQQHVAHFIRARLRAGRGDDLGAAEDADVALRLARAIRDPQSLDPALVAAAEVAYRGGDLAAANALLAEVGTERPGMWAVNAALLCHDLQRAPLVQRGDAQATRWSDAAQAIASGDLVEAAETLESTGARTLVAAVRLRAAAKAAAEGRPAESAEQLAPTLAFYREVEASAYVRDAEALLRAAS
jgi:hypothetical protein